MEDILSSADAIMKKRLEKFKTDLAGIRTGRANPQILDGVRVEYFGQPVPIKQVAAISVPEARVLEIRPWDASSLEAIVKALQKSDLGIPPQSDGTAVRLLLPAMTEDRRKEIIKLLGKTAEECRVAVRNERRDALEKLKKAEKAKQIAEDARKKQEDSIQKLTDGYIRKIDEALLLKEKEVTTI